jgi:hypothetical protein
LVRRITFNPGDEAEWRGAGPFERFLGPISAYPDWLAHYIAEHGITDIVLYGDSRPEHALAIRAARPRGILCHCLEEGYLRPHHVTYERWGNNGSGWPGRWALPRRRRMGRMTAGARIGRICGIRRSTMRACYCPRAAMATTTVAAT